MRPREYNVDVSEAYKLKSDPRGTKDRITANDIIKAVSDKGGNTDDYFNIYECDKDGNRILKKTIHQERGEGAINAFRVREDEKGTISASVTADKDGKEIYSIIMEAMGPSTKKAGLKQRIPVGEYGFILSKDRKCVQDAEKLRFPNNFVLYNKDVGDWRGITLHGGDY